MVQSDPSCAPPDRGYPQLRRIGIVSRRAVGRRSEWLEGVQATLDRTVAVKRLRSEFAAEPRMRELFFAAGREAADIVHPSAMSIYNIFPEQDCIVTEWSAEPTLRDRRDPVPALSVVRIATAIFDSLALLHATARSHGNLSPGNVFIDGRCGVRITDFFHPVVSGDGDALFPDDGRYVAPEVMNGSASDWRSDVYSVAAMLLDIVEPGAASGSGRLRDLLERMRDPRPENRGESPDDISRNLQRLRRLEESRAGLGGGSRRRGRRQYRRIPAELSVKMRRRSATPVETAAILSRIQDIGENGVFVATATPLNVGSIVELHFALVGQEDMIHAFGIVRWQSEPPFASGMGIQFVEVGESGIGRLRAYLRGRTNGGDAAPVSGKP